MPDQIPVSVVLSAGGYSHKVFQHPGPLRSLEQAAQERGQEPTQVVRSILFRVSEQEYIMVLVAGRHQIDWKTLRKYLGISRITMASPEEVQTVTGYQIGTVAPFGLSHPVRVLVDRSVLGEYEVSLGSGAPSVAIIIESKTLLEALGQYEIGDFSSR